MTRLRLRVASRVASALAALVLGACGTGPAGDPAARPRDGRAGVQLTGTLGGRQLALSDGSPRLIVGDCDPQDGPDRDLCFVSRAIDGTFVRIVFENPDVLVAGESVPARDVDCPPPACDEVTHAAIVDVQVGVGTRTRRATGGLVTASVIEPPLRYVGSLVLEFPEGRLSGTFDVVPRPER